MLIQAKASIGIKDNAGNTTLIIIRNEITIYYKNICRGSGNVALCIL